MRVFRPTLALALSLVLVLATASPASADELQSKVNAVRSNHLSLLSAADQVAQRSAAAQAAADTLSHTNLTPLLDVCTRAGEVIGEGATVDAIFDAFRGSPLHWKLITSADWTSMGTGLAVSATGTLYVSIVFCRAAGTPTPSAPSATTGAPPVSSTSTSHPDVRLQLPRCTLHFDSSLTEPAWQYAGACPSIV